MRRLALAVGGMGQSATVVEPCVRLGADCVIFGEVLDRTLRYALEAGLAVIESTHVSTEEAAMVEVAAALRGAFPGTAVHFVETEMPWWAV